MHDGRADSEPTRRTRRRVASIALAGALATAVAVAVLVTTGMFPGPPSRSSGSFQITGIVVVFTGSGAAALCPEAASSPPTCGSAALACHPLTLCNETLRTGDTVPLSAGVTFQAMLSDTFDCNYTYSIAQVSGAGAFTVTAAQANGAGLPVNIGFSGSGSACVTEANVSVGLSVGDQGPTEQNLFLTVSVAEELR